MSWKLEVGWGCRVVFREQIPPAWQVWLDRNSLQHDFRAVLSCLRALCEWAERVSAARSALFPGETEFPV